MIITLRVGFQQNNSLYISMLILKRFLLVILAASVSNLAALGQDSTDSSSFDILPLLNACNVSWNVPGPTSAQSMPIGNGDIGLNVWVEPSGDLAFYISKTDAWNADVQGSLGLMKLGGVHLSMNPSPLVPGAPFLQVLKVHDGEIQIKEGSDDNGVLLRVWVDANHPVIRVEMKSGQPVSVKVTQDDWRKNTPQGDVNSERILTDQTNRILWYHRNSSKADSHVANWTFGAIIKGEGLASKDATTLESSAPTTTQLVSIYPLAAATDTPDAWQSQLEDQVTAIDALDLEQTRQEHQKWWDQFWHRSWIFVRGEKAATEVTEGYVLQRFVTACAGRGTAAIKFNGSIFVVDDPTKKANDNAPLGVTADYRDWGGHYWFQNTRAMYWPLLQEGDYDMLMPLFKMYKGMMEYNAPIVKKYYGHEGSYFAEVSPFWGGLKYVGPEMPANWNDHYFTDILDLSMMMLDYYEYTGDKQFVKETLVPMATAGLLFFDKHFTRDDQGKLLLDPDNAIEMYWKAHDPAPDIAGLRAVLPRMIALPDDLVDDASREAWKKLLSEIPELPTGTTNGKTVLLPYTGPQTMKSSNAENPELYAIYPFRLYGLGKPDLQLAIDSFNARKCNTQHGCWVQDPIQAAMLGLTDVAKDYVHFNFVRTDPHLKFLAFWEHANDYQPDEDNGGNGENGLQQMLMQTVGKKILLLPAWPKNWDADFKLNAPFQTTVQGKIRSGKIIDLVVTPPERKDDVIDMFSHPDQAAPDASGG